MSDVPAASAALSPKKATTKPDKRVKASHPPAAEMVTAAIRALKSRKGSSLPAIRSYIKGNYKADVDKLSHFIKKALRNGVQSGKLVQVKGSGASGSFRLNAAAKAEKPKKPVVQKPAKKTLKAKKPATKKAVPKAKSPKKAMPKAKSPKKAAAKRPVAKKSPAKAKKPAAKKAVAKKSAAKKPAAKKPVARQPAARKAAPK